MDKTDIVDFSDILIEKENPCPDIYPRFRKVRETLVDAMYGCPNPEISREFGSVDWGDGVIDHKGRIVGISNGIRLNFTVRGTTVPRQPYIVNENGEWLTKIGKEESIALTGYFISKDGMEGAIDIVASDGEIIFEGYWLEHLHGDLILEQVVDIKRNVHTLEGIQEMPINKLYLCKNFKEDRHLYSIGVGRSQIFYEGYDKMEELERMQRNRDFNVPGFSSNIPMRKRKIWWSK